MVRQSQWERSDGNMVSTTIDNVPNRISAARLVLSVIVFAMISVGWYWGALVGFIIAAGTDWVDGWWARRYGQVTQLGRILDPFCDKILICGTYILLAVAMRDRFPWYASITGWMAVLVVARELLVTALRSFIEQSGGDFSAKLAGKLKMWLQCIAVAASLVALAQPSLAESPAWLGWVLGVSVWLALVSTVQSGAEYVAAAWRLVMPTPPPRDAATRPDSP